MQSDGPNPTRLHPIPSQLAVKKMKQRSRLSLSATRNGNEESIAEASDRDNSKADTPSAISYYKQMLRQEEENFVRMVRVLNENFEDKLKRILKVDTLNGDEDLKTKWVRKLLSMQPLDDDDRALIRQLIRKAEASDDDMLSHLRKFI